MAAKSIEAILRLSADVAGALAGLRQVRQEAAKPIQGPGEGGGASAGKSAKATTDEVVKETTRRTAAEKAADLEALAAKKAALRAQREAEAQARREQRQLEEAERRARRKAQAQLERAELQALGRQQRAKREEQRKLTQVAPQVTDIVTGLAGGQNPLLVALQQGGQLRDIFGGVGNAGRALLGIFTPLRVIVGGIAGSALLFGVNIAQGYFESERLRKSLALTGNAAGTSQGQINGLALQIAQDTAQGIGFVRDTLAALLQVNGQTASTLGSTGRAVAALAKLSGQSADEAVKAFADQADGITDWSTKANKAYNFLTEPQLAYIRRLESQGRVQEAIRFANDQLAQTLISRTGPALGTLEKAWSATTRAVSSFLDSIKAIGRDETAEDRLKKLQARLDEIRARQSQPLFGGRRRSTDANEVSSIAQEQGTLRRDQVRVAENAISLQAQQDAIFQHSKEMQGATTALTLAQESKRTAIVLAEIDKRRSAIEQADAQGLLSEQGKASALNLLDQQRLQAQERLQRKQLEAARAAVELEAKPQDRRAAEARVVDAETQLINTQTQLRAAVADARRIVDASNLEKSREEAQGWAEIWARADQQVRQLAADNALTGAVQNGDFKARAEAEAQVRVQELRRQVEETARDLRVRIGLAITPEAKAELRQQLGALLLEGSQAAKELGRRTQQESLQTQTSEQLEKLRQAEAALDLQVQQGAITTVEAEQRKFAAREAALPQLRAMLATLQTLATTDGERNAVGAVIAQLDQLADKSTEVSRTLKASIGSNFASTFTDIVTGAESAEDAVKKGLANIARSMLDLIARRLGEQLVNSLFGSSGGGGQSQGWLGTLLSAWVTTKHTGGLIDGTVSAGRAVAPWVFHGAQVLHSGGIAGLRANEQPAILMKGEEVLTADDPRHRNNIKRAGGAMFGDFNVSISLGGGGSSSDVATAQSLARGMKAAMEQYLAEQMRPGGMLQNVNRG